MPKKRAKKIPSELPLEEEVNEKGMDFAKDPAKNKEIADIYKDHEGETPDLTKLEKVPKRKGKIFILIVVFLFLAAGAAWGGFFLFNRGWGNHEDVEMRITGADKIKSGENITLEITYENKGKAEISKGEITVQYPNGFYFASANVSPVEGKNNTWTIQNVLSGAGGKIKIIGQLVGEVNNTKEFPAYLVYQPSNFRYDFQTSVKHVITIASSIVDIETDVPQRVKSDEDITYRVKFTNPSSLPLSNVKVIIDYPLNFEFKETDPKTEFENNTWRFDELGAGKKEEIKIQGKVRGVSYETKEFHFRLGLLEPNGNFNLQIEKSSLIFIVNPELSLTLDAPDVASLSDEVSYTIKAKNTSDVNIDGIKLKLAFSPALVEDKLLDKFNLPAKSDIEITPKITLPKKMDGQNVEFTATVSVEKAQVEKQDEVFSVTAEAKTKIQGNLSFSSQARYYDDDLTRIGAGPLPPQVNQQTSFVILWAVSAGNNDMQNVQVSTTLPEEVLIGSDLDGVSYDKKNRRVSWKIKSLSAGESQEARFSVSVTPTPEDLNKLLVLTHETLLNTQDSFTLENLTQTIESLTSDLVGDKAGSGKGVVESGS